MSLIPVALMMQLQGIEVNKHKQAELVAEWTVKRDELKDQLFTLIGREINFNSPKQMSQLLYMELGLPVQYKRRRSVKDKKTMTTDANAIRTLARLVPDNPVFNLILDYKKADMLLRFLVFFRQGLSTRFLRIFTGSVDEVCSNRDRDSRIRY